MLGQILCARVKRDSVFVCSFRGLLAFAFLVFTSQFQFAFAQSTSSGSTGCTAANAGAFDITLPALSSLTSAPFSETFAEDEVLTFSLTGVGPTIWGSLAEDTTEGVGILSSGVPTTVDYTIPASGLRDFNLELDTTESQGATLAVTCTPAVTEGSITIEKNSDASGDFGFTGDLGAFTLSVTGSSTMQSFSSLSPGTYNVTESAIAGFAVNDITCTGDLDSGSVIDVTAGTVAIDLDAGEDIVCSFSNVQSPPPPAGYATTQAAVQELSTHLIRNFLYRRATAGLVEEPDRARIVRKNPGHLWPDGITHLNARANENGAQVDFAGGVTPNWANKIDLWVEGHYTRYKSGSSAVFEGDLGVLYLGADYLASDDVLIGILGQFDWASESAASLGEDVSGSGWMIGPYVSTRLSRNLFFDLRGAWGRSSNELSIAGLITNDEFETDRWLIKGGFTGNEQFGKWRVTPSVSFVYFEEEQESYVSGTGFTVAAQSIALGRITFEPEVAYQHVTESGVLVEPQFNLAGIWDFETPENLSIPGWIVVPDEFRLRAGLGLLVAWPNGFAMRASGFYDGIGASTFESYGARLWLDIPIGKRNSPPPTPPSPPALPPQQPKEPDSANTAFLAGKANLSEDAYRELAALWAKAAGEDIAQIVITAPGDDTDLAKQRGDALQQALISLGAPSENVEIIVGTLGGDEATITIFYK